MSEGAAPTIRHDAAARRFECVVDGEYCELDYRLQDEVMSITHTGVPQAVGGRGIAGALTAFAFETARRSGWKVRPLCSYAAAWVRRHPEVRDLLLD